MKSKERNPFDALVNSRLGIFLSSLSLAKGAQVMARSNRCQTHGSVWILGMGEGPGLDCLPENMCVSAITL